MHKDLEQYMDKIHKHVSLPSKSVTSKLKKIATDDLVVPTTLTIDLLHQYNYNREQLKMIAKHHKLKQGGNKNELVLRIFQFLVLSKTIVQIQKVVRGHIRRLFVRSRGPGHTNRSVCVNTCDFLTMEELGDISNNQFFSFKDGDGFVYGFDVVSLYNLIYGAAARVGLRASPKNPYNRRIISADVFDALKRVIRIGKLIGSPINVDIEEEENPNQPEPTLENRIVNLFAEIDRMGHYTSPQWFSTLSIVWLRRFIRELTEIWNYRANISRDVKRNICPPYGDPFRNVRYSSFFTPDDETTDEQKKMVLVALETLVMSGVDEDSRALGAYYVLGTLTLVNRDAALAMPWLYESFQYH